MHTPAQVYVCCTNSAVNATCVTHHASRFGGSRTSRNGSRVCGAVVVVVIICIVVVVVVVASAVAVAVAFST